MRGSVKFGPIMVPAQWWYHHVIIEPRVDPIEKFSRVLRTRLNVGKSISRKLFSRVLKRVPLCYWILTCFILRHITDRDLATTKRAFIKGLFGLTVRKQAESSLLLKDLREKEVLLNTYRTRKSGKKVILKDQIIVSRESI
jgi:hypothetical protein